MSNQNTDYRVVYSLRIHIALQRMGFHYVTEMKNPQKPQLNCWVYENSEKFAEAFDSLLKEDEENG